MLIGEALRDAAGSLAATSDTARLDAELLMAHALGVTRSELLLRHTGDPAPAAFESLLTRRQSYEPVAYILGRQEFYGLELDVSPAVLIPRADSETLIAAAQAAFANESPQTILDLGTGSGALLLAALVLWPEAEGLGLDSSIEALMIATRNAQRHARTIQGFVGSAPADFDFERNANRGFARFIQGDWTKRGWRTHIGKFDLILANPPYVEEAADLSASVRDYEPASALFAGPDGLDDYRVLIPQLPALLNPEGVALVEIGHTQAPAVTALAEAAGLTARLHHDLGARPRALELRRPDPTNSKIFLGKRPPTH